MFKNLPICHNRKAVNLYSNFEVQLGGNPGLVVMGDDSCSKGHGFKSQRRILDGHFFTDFVVKRVMMFV